MPSKERRDPKCCRTLCATCRARKAKFRYRGEVRADRDGTLCFECYRGELNRARGRRLIAPIIESPHRFPSDHHEHLSGEAPGLRRVAHRQRMLAHLRQSGTVC
jgi:hypothetical protein